MEVSSHKLCSVSQILPTQNCLLRSHIPPYPPSCSPSLQTETTRLRNRGPFPLCTCFPWCPYSTPAGRRPSLKPARGLRGFPCGHLPLRNEWGLHLLGRAAGKEAERQCVGQNPWTSDIMTTLFYRVLGLSLTPSTSLSLMAGARPLSFPERASKNPRRSG